MVCGRYMIESVKSYILLQAPREMDFFFLYNQSEPSVFNAKRSLEGNSFLFPLKKKIIEKKKTQFIYADYQFKCVVV
jgi:hypothetical protein